MYFHLLVEFVFDYCRGTRAVGIEYVDDLIGRAKGTIVPIVARASRLVVLSAGASERRLFLRDLALVQRMF